jgi:hypothetical protein
MFVLLTGEKDEAPAAADLPTIRSLMRRRICHFVLSFS